MNSVIRILLLEDDEADYLLLAHTLGEIPGQTYEVDWVRSCAEALAILSQGEHDIGLMDYELVDGSGIDVIREAVERDFPAPMVLLTSHGAREVDLKAMKAGASDFLVKGEFTARLLERTIRYAIERRFAEYRLLESREELAQRNAELQEAKTWAEAQHANSLKLAEYLAQAEHKEQTANILAEENQQRYETLTQNSAVGIWQLSPEGITERLNPTMRALLEVEAAEVLPPVPFFQCFQTESERIGAGELASWINGNSSSFEAELVGRKTGRGSHVVVSGSPHFGPDGTLKQLLLTVIDITERKKAVDTMRTMARRDALTGLFNRFVFQDRLLQAMSNAERIGRSMAVLYMDLDDFKGINDTLGHQAGDELLQHVAGQIRATTRSSDTAARLGGDEFAIILTNLQTPEGAILVARQLLDKLAQSFDIDGHKVKPGVSIGITLFPQDANSPEQLLKNADTALYRAKATNRGGFQFYDSSFAAPIEERRAIEFELRRALDQNQLVLHYQPQIEIQSGRITGVESLVRWESPSRGLVPPADFIPVAESTGLIVPIGEWVLREACRQTAAWQAQGLPVQRTAVNLSAGQLQSGDLADTVSRILDEAGLAAKHLELEITESMVLDDIEQASSVLRSLRQLGVGIAMDDFGTGYSSLTYLKVFPVDQLKIDRSFVSRIPDEPDNTAIVTATIVLGHSLNVRVVAEGVETEDQSSFLRQIGCDEVQGYHYCKPLPADELSLWLSGRAARASPDADLAPAH